MSFKKLMEPNYSNKILCYICGGTNRFYDNKRTIKQKKFVVGSPQSAVKDPTVKHLSSLQRTANSHTWSSRYSRLCQVFIVFMNCVTRLPLTLILEKHAYMLAKSITGWPLSRCIHFYFRKKNL